MSQLTNDDFDHSNPSTPYNSTPVYEDIEFEDFENLVPLETYEREKEKEMKDGGDKEDRKEMKKEKRDTKIAEPFQDDYDDFKELKSKNNNNNFDKNINTNTNNMNNLQLHTPPRPIQPTSLVNVYEINSFYLFLFSSYFSTSFNCFLLIKNPTNKYKRIRDSKCLTIGP